MEDLEEWLNNSKINYSVITNNVYKINNIDENFYFVNKLNGSLLFDQNMDFFLDFNERKTFIEYNCKFYVFEFGGNFYYSYTYPEFDFNLLKNLGTCKTNINLEFCNLSIHGGYELLNGSGDYSDWCKKAKFFNHKFIGVAENNTLSSLLSFQNSALQNDLKSIFGETIGLEINEKVFRIKVYVKNRDGWLNLLKIHKKINVDSDNDFISIDDFLNHVDGIILVVPQDFDLSLIDLLNSVEDIYYQFDLNIWKSSKRDLEQLNFIKNYIENFYTKIKPVVISDCYYIEKTDSYIKNILNKIGDIKFNFSCDTLFFKNVDDIYDMFGDMFSNKKHILEQSILNTIEIAKKCDFEINTEKFRLPKYELTQQEKLSFSNSEELFAHLVNSGLSMKVKCEDKKVYQDRLDEEIRVIKKGGLIDYFLILWDIIQWTKKENILRGIGRGSAAGSLVSYLLDITEADPIKYDLLFERFLNESRIGKYQDINLIKINNELEFDLNRWIHVIRDNKKINIRAKNILKNDVYVSDNYELVVNNFETITKNVFVQSGGSVDIDCDFPGLKRDEVKKYMEFRYGQNCVASIGTYSTMKIKMGIKDISRVFNIPFNEVNLITSYLTKHMVGDGKNFKDIFEACCKDTNLKTFVKNNVDVINALRVVLNQPRSSSIHASAVIITPKFDEYDNSMDIFNWLPVRKVGDILVSEWEYKYVEQAGFLKEDILGIAQLDKFQNIVSLIKNNYKKDLDIYSDIPLDDEEVYKIFHLGLNEDVFQFGSQSQKAYSKLVKPDNIEHLNAMNALYRPGPMDVNAHVNYYKIKNGEKKEEYYWGTEEVLKSTYGLIVYQEQTMKIAQILADFNLTEADGLRRALTKKGKGNEAQNFKNVFIERCVNKGCTIDNANEIWGALEAFTKYGFNRSHSLCYAITGYICQWFKVNYPLEFWITSLQYSKDDEIFVKISEINKLNQGVTVTPPDINKARNGFYADIDTKNIYWSLSKIKYVGDIAVNIIIEEREKNGDFFSLEEFLSRVPKSKINKRVVYNLIISGAFDEIAYINQGSELKRRLLINEYCKLNKKPEDDLFNTRDAKNSNEFWILKQKESCGLGYINYNKILKQRKDFIWPKGTKVEWIDEQSFFTCEDRDIGIIGGIVNFINKKQKKDKSFFCELKIECNNEQIICTIWTEEYEKYKEVIDNSLNKIILISGEVTFNRWRNINTFKSVSNTNIITL